MTQPKPTTEHCGCSVSPPRGTDSASWRPTPAEAIRFAVALVAFDENFAGAARQIGHVFGQRIARALPVQRLSLREALTRLPELLREVGFCGCEVDIGSEQDASIRLLGCGAILGFDVSPLGRPVCSGDEGLISGLLEVLAAGHVLRVKEVRCLCQGSECCEFSVSVVQ